MAKRRTHRSQPVKRESFTKFIGKDLAGWNFVIFLTLAFVLLVVVLGMTKNLTAQLQVRAGLKCPDPLTAFNGHLPAPADCNGTWQLTPNGRGCQVFVCKPD